MRHGAPRRNENRRSDCQSDLHLHKSDFSRPCWKKKGYRQTRIRGNADIFSSAFPRISVLQIFAGKEASSSERTCFLPFKFIKTVH